MTRCQYEVYKKIKKYIKENGYSPSIRELCDMINKSSTGTIQTHLKNLKKLGYISYVNNKGRTIRITKEFNCSYDKELSI